MRHDDTHLSDQELLLAADGELTARAAARVQSHLAACWLCRSRKQEMERAVGEFVREYRTTLDAEIPPGAGPRALLKARMAQMQAGDRGVRIPGFPLWFAPAVWSAFLLAGALVLLGVFVVPSWLARKGDRAARPGAAVVTVPDPSLTPGATMLVSREQVCKASNTNNRMVPATLQRKVFEEYGIGRAEPHAYEVDYLITPALGGADDIHNLWPESYEATVWNARVKDALEDHLRDMVCGGQLDLMTAQREIAMNWIEAYKKYFHTDRPLTR